MSIQHHSSQPYPGAPPALLSQPPPPQQQQQQQQQRQQQQQQQHQQQLQPPPPQPPPPPQHQQHQLPPPPPPPSTQQQQQQQHHQQRVFNATQAEQPQYPSSGGYHPQAALQSPFLGSQQHFQQPPENTYYASNPSPRSQQSSAGNYYPTDKAESMAATAAMQRPYPPIYSTPQSNSPASVTSPHQNDHRPMYGQPAPHLGGSMYNYTQYQPMNPVHQPSPYAQHQNQPQPHPLNSQPILQQYQPPHPQLQQSHSTVSSSPRLKNEPPQQYQQPPQQRTPMMQPQHGAPAPPSAGLPQHQQQQPGGPASSSNAAPGPIPATTPLVVRQDGNGVQWIAFEYSRDRVKMEYTIRCDVESVNTDTLSQEFKSENCVYPRACVPKEQYKGNRLAYETDCNQVGWALAELNPPLRGKRGLIQRAVDSWRNSNQDPRLRSRRVRRQAKMNNRSKMSSVSAPPPPPGSAGLAGSASMPAPSARPRGSVSTGPQLHHHAGDVTVSGPEAMTPSAYAGTPQQYRQGSASSHIGSPNDIRQAQVFPGYQTYPTVPTTIGPSMSPSIQGGMHHLARPGGPAAMASSGSERRRSQDDIALFGDVPEEKRRKFILVEDTQKASRVRVKVTLDQIEMSEIPDSYRKQNSVFPRAYFPVQMQTARESSRHDRFVEEGEEVDGGAPVVGKTSVPAQVGGDEYEVSVPQISKSKRAKEEKFNDIGYRMAWGQGRVFSNRPIFLARAVDAFRSKQRGALMSAGHDAASIPDHLELRPGKRRWLERQNTVKPPVEALPPPS